MKFEIKPTKIRDLIALIQDDKIDLSPSYQRNFIWSKKDQSSLVDTILKGYPLPNLFIYSPREGKYEMVDGQQRTRTIYRFFMGEIQSSNKTKFNSSIEDVFLNYKLPIVYISDLNENDSLNEFYVLINKKGKVLNTPEVHKAEHFDHPFMKLADDVLSYQPYIDLGIFSESTAKRMNDRAFTEELLAFIIFGVSDKKNGVEKAYANAELIELKYADIKESFQNIIDRIKEIQLEHTINKTRYRQKNDFYTLFSYIHNNNDIKLELLKFQYKILVLLNQKDEYGNQFISPSNEDSLVLREYALNCVSQSNSKKAREKRLSFFEEILLNKNISENILMQDVFDFLSNMYGKKNIELVDIYGYQLINADKIEL